MVAGSPFPADIQSLWDDVEGREVRWLIDRHSSLFWLGQNIHVCSFGLKFFEGREGPVAVPGESGVSCYRI